MLYNRDKISHNNINSMCNTANSMRNAVYVQLYNSMCNE